MVRSQRSPQTWLTFALAAALLLAGGTAAQAQMFDHHQREYCRIRADPIPVSSSPTRRCPSRYTRQARRQWQALREEAGEARRKQQEYSNKLREEANRLRQQLRDANATRCPDGSWHIRNDQTAECRLPHFHDCERLPEL